MKMRFFFFGILAVFFFGTAFSAVSEQEISMEDPLLAVLQEVGIVEKTTEKEAPKIIKTARQEKRKNVQENLKKTASMEGAVVAKGKMKVMETKEEVCEVPAQIPAEIEQAFAEAVKGIPCHLLQTLRTVEIFEDSKKELPRGLANGRKLKIRSDMLSSPDLVNVLKHELGHVVDLGGLSSQNFSQNSAFEDGSQMIFSDDPSVEFYAISWQKTNVHAQGTTDSDFVGGYAGGDMFEDFAEAFLAYQIQGKVFRGWAQENEKVAKKYEFLRTKVFGGKEFDTGYSTFEAGFRPWDMTKF